MLYGKNNNNPDVGAISRTAFLRGNFKASNLPIRPPWALDEDAFRKACRQPCDRCRTACPEAILTEGADGYPQVSFFRGECTFCGDCAEACPTEALTQRGEGGQKRPPWQILVAIDNSCLSLNGTTCRVCGDQCETHAITFRLATGGVALPVFDSGLCIGCGACVAPCPVKAVTVQPITQETQQQGA